MRSRNRHRDKQKSHRAPLGIVITRGVEFIVIVFHCPQTMALSHLFPSYIIPSYWVASHVAVRPRWLGINYLAAIFLC